MTPEKRTGFAATYFSHDVVLKIARYADIVFAKDDLQAFCQRENISYYLYESFHDVTGRLTELLDRRQLRKRRRAELKRMEAFQRES